MFAYPFPCPGKRLTRCLLLTYILVILVTQRNFLENIIEWMREETRQPDVNTIKETIEKNYTFYVNNQIEHYGEMEIFTKY